VIWNCTFVRGPAGWAFAGHTLAVGDLLNALVKAPDAGARAALIRSDPDNDWREAAQYLSDTVPAEAERADGALAARLCDIASELATAAGDRALAGCAKTPAAGCTPRPVGTTPRWLPSAGPTTS